MITRALYVILVIGLLLSGCTTAGQKPSGGRDAPERPKASDPAGQPKSDPAEPAPNSPAEPEPEPDTVSVYFSNEQGNLLLKELREVGPDVDKPQLVAQELIKGPADPGHLPTIPRGTRLLGVSVRDGVANINFSSEFVTNHTGGASGELMTVYSVVNSLTDLFQINQVRFLVNGQPIETLNALDLTEPLERESGLIGSE